MFRHISLCILSCNIFVAVVVVVACRELTTGVTVRIQWKIVVCGSCTAVSLTLYFALLSSDFCGWIFRACMTVTYRQLQVICHGQNCLANNVLCC